MTITGTPITPVSADFSNSYIESSAELGALIGNDLRPSAIALKAASDTDQAWYCQEASRFIDSLPLRGERYEPEYIYNGAQKDTNADGLIQTLAFPRVIDATVCDWDNYTQKPIVPQAVKEACCLIAISLYEDIDNDDFSEKALQEAGVQSFSRGKLSVTFQNGAGSRYMGMPKRAYDLLRKYIDMGPRVL